MTLGGETRLYREESSEGLGYKSQAASGFRGPPEIRLLP